MKLKTSAKIGSANQKGRLSPENLQAAFSESLRSVKIVRSRFNRPCDMGREIVSVFSS